MFSIIHLNVKRLLCSVLRVYNKGVININIVAVIMEFSIRQLDTCMITNVMIINDFGWIPFFHLQK